MRDDSPRMDARIIDPREVRESEVESYLVRRVVRAGGIIRKVRWIGRHGAPDRRVMLPWRLCWLEVKAPGEQLEPHQAREHKRMADMGEDVGMVDSKAAVDIFMEAR